MKVLVISENDEDFHIEVEGSVVDVFSSIVMMGQALHDRIKETNCGCSSCTKMASFGLGIVKAAHILAHEINQGDDFNARTCH